MNTVKRNLILFFILLSCNAYGQSLTVFDVDASAFPAIKAKFWAFDASGDQIANLSPSDFSVTENDQPRAVTFVSCPVPKPPQAISVVLTIDVSGSMSGNGLNYARSAAIAFVNALPLGKSECAITTFNSNNYYNQDFTTNRNKLLDAINKLSASGGTNYNAGFIDPMAGALLAVEKGKHKKAVIFLTDGKSNGNEAAIIQKASQINAAVYCVALNMRSPEILKNIATRTGGQWFENVTSAEQARQVYQKILQMAQGYGPCMIEWESGIKCTEGSTIVEIKLNSLNLMSNVSYLPSRDNIARLEFNPSSVYFLDKTPGVKHDTTITVTAINADFNVSNITGNNPAFQISPSSFSLATGESTSITLSFTPVDSGYTFAQLDFINNLCTIKYFESGGFRAKKPRVKTLKLTRPNGGEVFVVGSDTVITWEGISPKDTVVLDYSIDNGQTWKRLSDNATGLRYEWKNVPKPASNQCLVRIKQFGYGGGSDSIPHIQWQKTLGGSNFDQPFSIQQTYSGGYIVAGFTLSNDGDVTGKNKSNDFWIVKLDVSGNLQWQKTLGGSRIDFANSIQQTNDGGYIVAGSTESNDGDVTGNNGGNDYWVVKLDAIGNIQWQKTLGGSGWDKAQSIQQTNDGGYIVTGLTESDDGDVTGNKGRANYWVVKLDVSGNIQWQKTIGGSNYDQAKSIQQTLDGGYVLAGYTLSNDGDVTGNKGDEDYWVVKLDVSGNLQWQKTMGGSNKDQANSIRQTNDGGFVVAGWTSSWDGDVTENKAWMDYWVVKLDISGNLQWQKTMGGSNWDKANSIRQTNDGGFVVAGFTGSNDGDVTLSKGQSDYWVVKLDGSGNLQWEKTLGGSERDEGNSIQQTKDGGYIVAGYSKSNDGDVTGNKGSSDYWIVKLSPEGTILQEDVSDAVFSIVEPKLSSTDIDMGQVIVGEAKNSVITEFISNTGSWKFRVDSIYFRGADASAFSMVSGFPKYVVDTGLSHHAEFRFIPSRTGLHQAEIVIISQADTLIQNIIGEGVERKLQVFSDIIDFGTLEIGDYKDITKILLTNFSTNDITIISTANLGPDTEQFEIISGGGSFTLAAKDTRELTLRFAPRYIGRASGRIGFYYDGAGSPATAQLFGAGREAIGWTLYVSDDSAYAGDKFYSSIYLENESTQKLMQLVDSVNGVVRVQHTILAPAKWRQLIEIINDSTYIAFSGKIDSTTNEIARIKFVAGLGNVKETAIDIVEFNWFDKNGEIVDYGHEVRSGRFKLLGICPKGGDRLLNPAGKVGMIIIIPNPANESVEIKFDLIEKGPTKLTLTNLLGESIDILYENNGNTGQQAISYNINGLSSGTYYIILQTPTIIKSQQLEVIR